MATPEKSGALGPQGYELSQKWREGGVSPEQSTQETRTARKERLRAELGADGSLGFGSYEKKEGQEQEREEKPQPKTISPETATSRKYSQAGGAEETQRRKEKRGYVNPRTGERYDGRKSRYLNEIAAQKEVGERGDAAASVNQPENAQAEPSNEPTPDAASGESVSDSQERNENAQTPAESQEQNASAESAQGEPNAESEPDSSAPESTGNSAQESEGLENQTRSHEQEKISQEVLDKLDQYQISQEDLKNIEGFSELSPEKQEFLVKDLEGVLLHETQKTGVEKRQEWKGSRSKWKHALKQVGTLGIYEYHQEAKLKKEARDEVSEKEAVLGHTSTLVEKAKTMPEVERNEDGTLHVKYASERDFFGEREPSREEKEKLKEFNEAAKQWGKIPHEWGYEGARLTRKELNDYNEKQKRFSAARARMQELNDQTNSASETAGEKARAMNRIDERIALDRIFNAHPEAEAELAKIDNRSALREAGKNFWKTKGSFLVYGGAARYGAAALAGAATGGWGALAAIGLTGGAAGTEIGRREARKQIDEERAARRHGGKGRETISYTDKRTGEQKERGMKEHTNAQFISDRLHRLRSKVHEIHEDPNRRDENGEFTQKAREELSAADQKLAQTVAYAMEKREAGTVNWGENQLDSKLTFSQELEIARRSSEQNYEQMRENYENLISKHQESIEGTRTHRAWAQASKAGMWRAGFAAAGAGIVGSVASETAESASNVSGTGSVEQNGPENTGTGDSADGHYDDPYFSESNTQTTQEEFAGAPYQHDVSPEEAQSFQNYQHAAEAPTATAPETPSGTEVAATAAAPRTFEGFLGELAQSYTPEQGGNIWNELERRLADEPFYKQLGPDEKLKALDVLEDRIQSLPAEEIKAAGINSGNPNEIVPGEPIDFGQFFQNAGQIRSELDEAGVNVTAAEGAPPQSAPSVEPQSANMVGASNTAETVGPQESAQTTEAQQATQAETISPNASDGTPQTPEGSEGIWPGGYTMSEDTAGTESTEGVARSGSSAEPNTGANEAVGEDTPPSQPPEQPSSSSAESSAESTAAGSPVTNTEAQPGQNLEQFFENFNTPHTVEQGETVWGILRDKLSGEPFFQNLSAEGKEDALRALTRHMGNVSERNINEIFVNEKLDLGQFFEGGAHIKNIVTGDVEVPYVENMPSHQPAPENSDVPSGQPGTPTDTASPMGEAPSGEPGQPASNADSSPQAEGQQSPNQPSGQSGSPSNSENPPSEQERPSGEPGTPSSSESNDWLTGAIFGSENQDQVASAAEAASGASNAENAEGQTGDIGPATAEAASEAPANPGWPEGEMPQTTEAITNSRIWDAVADENAAKILSSENIQINENKAPVALNPSIAPTAQELSQLQQGLTNIASQENIELPGPNSGERLDQFLDRLQTQAA